MDFIAISLIRFYQKYISPRKGFRCAHAYLHNGVSCSNAVIDIINKNGVWSSYSKVRQRMLDCRSAYQAIQEDNKNPKKKDKPLDCGDPSIGCDAASCIGRGKSNNSELPCDCGW